MRIFTIVTTLILLAVPAFAQDTTVPCKAEDKACLMDQLESITGQIDEQDWKDQTYREIAKLLVHEKQNERAIGLIAKIKSPDKKAMTIRGIGMEAAKMELKREEYDALFKSLRAEAEKIDYPPSYAIALNYIADAQAQSGDDDAAMKTALGMENDEMRNKALYDCAKIQADRDDLDHAKASIAAIDNPGFRDKGYRDISKIFADNKKYDHALGAASAIDNSYQKAQSVLYILAKQITPEEVSLVE